MGTFFGGSQLAEVKTFTRDDSGNAITIYTVPAGRYAEAFIMYSTPSGSNPVVADYQGLAGTEELFPPGVNRAFTGEGVILQAGDSLELIGIGTFRKYSILVKEYLLP